MKRFTFMLCTVGAVTVLQAGGWNDAQAIANGKVLFAANCASCHGPEGIGPQSPALQGKRTDGKLQPPALNGSAHTWHHAPDLLRKIITQGGKTYGKGYVGWMPAFQASLTQKERDDILKYVHNLWPQKIKKRYDERFGISK